MLNPITTVISIYFLPAQNSSRSVIIVRWRLIDASEKWVTSEHLCRTLKLNPCILKEDVIFAKSGLTREMWLLTLGLRCANLFRIICLTCSLIPPVISILAALVSNLNLEWFDIAQVHRGLTKEWNFWLLWCVGDILAVWAEQSWYMIKGHQMIDYMASGQNLRLNLERYFWT